jgi:Uma2 family endonuclease
MTVTTMKWTIEDYHRLIEAGILDDRHVELINGEIVEMVPEGIPHAGLGNAGGNYLRSLLGDRAIIREGHPVTLPNDSEPEPDLAIVQPLTKVYCSDHHPYVENIFWLVEYSESSLLKDTELKRKAYAAAGIREYWVVNLKNRELIVYRDPVQGDYQSEVRLTDGDIYPLAFPTIAVSVKYLLGR